MLKKTTVILVLLTVLFSTMPAFAASHSLADVQENVIYERIINVTEDGGVYKVGFTEVKFPKEFIDGDRLPVSINVEISAVDGMPGIEFSPDMLDFNKEVTIIVHAYNGLLYDKTLGKNILVHIKSQKLKVTHFSRYAFS